MKPKDIYSFSIERYDDVTVPFSDFKGKVILIVNTAIHSPFASFYPFLQRLYLRYQSDGLEIIDIPSNQFKEQCPESEEEIQKFRKESGITFFLAKKSEVTGDNILPLYDYLIHAKKFQGFDPSSLLAPVLASREIKKNPNWEKDSSIKENFTFFLIDRNGKPRKRSEATVDKAKLEKAIESLLYEPTKDVSQD